MLRRGYSQRSDGRLQYTFNYKKERFYVYGHTYAECEEKVAALKYKLDHGIFLESQDITLNEYFELWIQRKHKIRESTKYTNTVRWEKIKHSIGKRRIVDIEPIHVERFQATIAKELSTAGTNHTIELLRMVLNGAIKDRIITFNPCDNIEGYERNEPLARDTNHRALEKWEQELFFKHAKGSWFYELFAFMISTGVRIGEAAALTWSDIDYSHNQIHINKTLSRTSNTEYVIAKPKTKNSLRDIPLTDTVKEILRQQREKTKVLKLWDENGSIDNRIFSAVEGGYIMRGSVNSSIDFVLKKIKQKENVDIPHFSSHAFRATFATRAIEQGMDMNTLKTLLGHAKLAITMDLYAHVLPNTKYEELNKIKFAF